MFANLGRLLAAPALACLLVAPLPAAAEPPPSQTVILGSGEASGLYYPLAGAICRLVNKGREHHGLRCLVEPSAGSGANLTALRSGDIDLAIVQSRAQMEAFQGTGAFAELGAFADLRSLASLHGETVVLLAGKDVDLKTLADLKGKKASLGRPKTFQRLMAEAALSAAGLTSTDLAATLELDMAEQKAALCGGQINAAFFSGLHPLAVVQEAITECEAQVVNLSELATPEALAKVPFLAAQTLAADTYAGVDADLTSLAMKATLVTTTKLGEDAAYAIVEAIAKDFDRLRAMHPQLQHLDRDGLGRAALTAPLHSGAERFYSGTRNSGPKG